MREKTTEELFNIIETIQLKPKDYRSKEETKDLILASQELIRRKEIKTITY